MGAAGSSLRNVESVTHLHLPVAEEPPLMEGEPLDMHSNQHLRQDSNASYALNDDARDITPTNETPRPLNLNTTADYSPVDPQSFDSLEKSRQQQPSQNEYGMQATFSPGDGDYDPYQPTAEPQEQEQQSRSGGTYLNYSPIEFSGSGGGLRVANPSSDGGDDDWGQDALRHMNLGR